MAASSTERQPLRAISEHSVNALLFDMLHKQFQTELSVVECTKAMIVHLSHLLESLIVTHRLPALFCSSFPDSSPWRDELERYDAVAETATVYLFSRKPLPPPTHPRITHVTLPDDGSSRQEWFTAIYAPTLAVVLCGHDTLDTNAETEMPYTAIWSFVPEHAQRTMDVLEQVIERVHPDQLAALQQARQTIPHSATDARLMTIFSAEMIRFEESLRVTLARTSRALDAQLQWREDLTATLVHDLRTPLQGIILALQMFRLKHKNIVDTSTIDIALRSANTLNTLAQLVLDTNVLEAQEFRLQGQVIDPSQLIAEAVESLTPLLLVKNQTLEVVIDPVVLPIWGDPTMLLRVMQNLLTNAVKFTNSNGTITITTQPDATAAQTEIAISDTGSGIIPTALPHIFERHYQARQGDGRGSGLGLYFCKLAVEAHGGEIRADSEVGVGTTITISLPATL